MNGPAFARVRAVRAHEQIVEQLQHSILRGDLPAGSRLPSERAMMGQFQVSRPTVREALRVAENLGLVTVRQGDPAGPLVIAQPSVGIAHVFNGMLRSERMAPADLVELRLVLDGEAARFAAGQPRAAAAAVDEAYRKMLAAGELAEFIALDARFHYAIAMASGNRLIALVLEALDEPIHRLIESGLSTAPAAAARQTTLRQHGEILAAIRAGQPEAACHAARRHLYDLYAPALGAKQRQRAKALLQRDPA
jgi:DNA-binding FadR family transcriptional regulator